MTDLRTVQITNIQTDTSQMSSESVWVAFDGRSVQIEWWGTDSSSGIETYEDNVPVDEDELVGALEPDIDAAKATFYRLWQERVAPMIQQITEETLAEHGGPHTICLDEECEGNHAGADKMHDLSVWPRGRCDTCGARCDDSSGECTVDSTHAVALEVPTGCLVCGGDPALCDCGGEGTV